MKTLTVSQLRALIEHLPGDTLVVGNECDHSYSTLHYAEYNTVLDDGNGSYTQDIFLDGPMGEETEYGVRIKALIIE